MEILMLGFLLGLKHSFEADHVAAMGLLNEKRSALWWGIGHTATLFAAGILVMIFRVPFPQTFSSLFEMLVAIFLISFGIHAFFNFWKQRKIFPEQHVLIHSHPPFGQHSHPFPSLALGIVHGFAGSGVLILVIAAAVQSALLGLVYILIFGLGSTIGMCLANSSLVFAKRFVNNKAPLFIGFFSVISGISLIYSLIFA